MIKAYHNLFGKPVMKKRGSDLLICSEACAIVTTIYADLKKTDSDLAEMFKQLLFAGIFVTDEVFDDEKKDTEDATDE